MSQLLTVTDIERLAKAGVKIDFKDIAKQVQVDYSPVPMQHEKGLWPPDLQASFWQRWGRANPSRYGTGLAASFLIYASEFGDKVYLYVAPTDAEPFVLEDDKHLYPSDALMAKLHLWEKSKP